MQAWDAFLCDLEQKIGQQIVEKWLRPLKLVQFDACNLYLEAENSFQISWFEEHIRKLAQKSLLNNNGHLIKVHFVNLGSPKKQKKEEVSAEPLEIPSDFIDPSLDFTSFITDHQNELTVKFFKQLTPGAFNPLFLHGAKGVGKTHLLLACANKLKAQNLSVFYVHAETFTEHVVKAIRNSQMRQFREIYRHQDVLIIDGIHCLARRTATQEEFFHTFNSLHTTGKQIILSSHLLPSQMEDIEPRLISRFEWGILFQLHPLNKSKMEQVLKNKARHHGFALTTALAAFLVEHFSTSSKSLLQALDALLLRHPSSEDISPKEAAALLQDLLQEEEKNKIDFHKILHATSLYFGVCGQDILGKSQVKDCVYHRKIAMYLCRKKLHLPYLTIGRIFSRDHSTVMTNVKQIEEAEQETKEDIKKIEEILEKEKSGY